MIFQGQFFIWIVQFVSVNVS